jgi:hypothetical protein
MSAEDLARLISGILRRSPAVEIDGLGIKIFENCCDWENQMKFPQARAPIAQ